ncbi:hypothetical protein ACIP93_32700 [Streptomyces sp. NPDC088745]|uniref:hypothetical protein n=1 Tax=Streptomyces sp. NPDC088745 TaxID=3365884 RepID=UPI0037F5D958
MQLRTDLAPLAAAVTDTARALTEPQPLPDRAHEPRARTTEFGAQHTPRRPRPPLPKEQTCR